MTKKQHLLTGIVVKFDKKRGYGFIRSKHFDKDCFVHISDIYQEKKLAEGQEVKFETKESERGISAVNVIPGKKQISPYWLYWPTSLAVVLMIMSGLIKFNCNTIIAYVISINIATFLLYGYDKYISKGQLLRVPESILLGISFCGGTIGGLAGQKYFRHKTFKTSFKNRYKMVVAIQVFLVLSIGLTIFLF